MNTKRILQSVAAIILVGLSIIQATVYSVAIFDNLYFSIAIESAVAFLLLMNQQIEQRLTSQVSKGLTLSIIFVLSSPNALFYVIQQPELFSETGDFVGAPKDIIIVLGVSMIILILQMGLALIVRDNAIDFEEQESNTIIAPESFNPYSNSTLTITKQSK